MSNTISPKKLLLHVCCAPCSGAVIDLLLKEGLSPTVYFYNPNIYPRNEYDLRKDSIVKYVNKLHLPLVDADYDSAAWLEQVKGLENEPERGKRCSKCFDMRLERTALYAHENGFGMIATTNGFARWKDQAQVNQSGLKAASKYPGMIYWDRNWRLGGAQTLAAEITKQENFYRQTYCGCQYSINKP
jgi:predicted adenine nucleotide alpha hydrolase (AANH) superfamily ATPase